MKIKIIGVGKLKEKYLVSGIQEYTKRLQAYCQLEIIEVNDEPINDQYHNDLIKDKEATRILTKIKKDDYVIALDLQGKQLDSIELSKHLESCMLYGKGSMVWVIGGSLGLGEAVLKRADLRLSFSKLTFPHQLMRLILLEQIYRSFKIMKNETYHK